MLKKCGENIEGKYITIMDHADEETKEAVKGASV